MINYLTNTFIIKAAGCIEGLRTESSIVTGGGILSIVKRVITNVCYSVLLETEIGYNETIMG